MTAVREIPTHFGDVVIAQLGLRDRRFGMSPVEYKMSYINNLPIPVTVVMRSGLKFVLKPEHSMTCNKLIVRTEIIVNQSARFDLQKLLSSVDGSSSKELVAMREALDFQIKENRHGNATLIIDYALTYEKLKSFGGTIYFHELDLVITANNFESAMPHPYSKEGRDLEFIVGSKGHFQESRFSYEIEIIDNNSRFGPRYVNIGNKIFKINPIKDLQKEDGIYVLSDSESTGALVTGKRDVTYFQFEDAEEKLGLFRTYEEAKDLGDASSARKFEIAKMERAADLLKAELQNAKHKQEMDALAREKELKTLEMEREKHAEEITKIRETREHELKMERERTKDFYEHKSYARKDESEILKAIPTIIVGLASIFMLVKSYK